MGRRASYMYGALLEHGPEGQVGSGLGQTTSLGTITLIPPTVEIGETGRSEVVDGVEMTFQLTPGTEAPAEMNIHFPRARALCVADNVARSMHNILTPRGALVRDPRSAAHYLDEAIELFGAESDVLFSGHNWPCWDSEWIVDYLEKQRDLYTYLHDQTLRLLNKGHTGAEIAELIELPPSLAEEWHCRASSSVSHNTKAIYQRYMAGSTATRPTSGSTRRSSRPPLRRVHGRRRGGAGEGAPVLRGGRLPLGRRGRQPRRLRGAGDGAARELQADTLEQLGYGAENATWRNFFLMGAKELREGIGGTPTATAPPDIVANLSVAQLLDAMAIRLDGPRAWDRHRWDRLGDRRARRGARADRAQRRAAPPPRPP